MATTEERSLVERGMTVFEILRNDHQTVVKIIEELKSAPVREMEGLLAELDNVIIRHAAAEEKYIYPKLSLYRDLMEVMQGAPADHDFLRDCLQKMQSVEIESGRWLPYLEALEQRFREHATMEERRLFPRAGELLPKDELDHMKEQVLTEKERSPQPRRHRDNEPSRRQIVE